MAPLNVKAENKPTSLKQLFSIKSVYRTLGKLNLDRW